MAFKKFTASEDMLKPDPRFNSKLVSKFINCLMWDGKKTVAQKIFYDAMDKIAKKMQGRARRWKSSRRRSTTSSRTSKCAPSASAEPTTRCRCR